MNLGLTDKVALITGGSKGIGFQTALDLSAEGAHVAIVARSEEHLQKAKDEIKEKTGREVLTISADVSQESECKRAVDEAVAHFGKLHILVNNAGTAAAKAFEDVDGEAWQNDLDLKLGGTIHCSRYAIPHMKEQGGGAIVNLAAVVAKTPPASSLPSSVSRSAGLALTQAMSKDLGKHNIRVNAVCIGLIRSDQIEKMWQNNRPDLTWDEFSHETGKGIPLGRIGDTQEASNVITFLVSDAASYVTGTAVNIDGGSGNAL
ncbi:SDR family NAD(P)-dependent oxidoreductase [Chryseomicrobium imtechense]